MIRHAQAALDGVSVLMGHDQRDKQLAECALQLRDQFLGVPRDEVADRAVERVGLIDALLAAAASGEEDQDHCSGGQQGLHAVPDHLVCPPV